MRHFYNMQINFFLFPFKACRGKWGKCLGQQLLQVYTKGKHYHWCLFYQVILLLYPFEYKALYVSFDQWPTYSHLVKQGAELVLIGLHRNALQVDDYLNDIVFKSLTLHTVHGRRIFQTWEAGERLVAEGKVKPSMIVSHQYKMSDFTQAFETLMSGKACKIVVDPKEWNINKAK